MSICAKQPRGSRFESGHNSRCVSASPITIEECQNSTRRETPREPTLLRDTSRKLYGLIICSRPSLLVSFKEVLAGSASI